MTQPRSGEARQSARASNEPSGDGEEVSSDQLRQTLAASRALVALSAQSISSVEADVDVVQFRVLVVVAGKGSTSLSQLAEGARISLTRASRLCERMVGMGLLARTEDPGDRRQLILTLTSAGRQLVRQVTRRREHAIAAILQRVPEPDRATVAAGFAAFAAAAGESPDPDLWGLGWTD
ncbi:MAG: MarR family transcriptional regulator [Actinomycetota bacterium]|nr:MarR family transcriptional regulator [Actinomycetota bacterium]